MQVCDFSRPFVSIRGSSDPTTENSRANAQSSASQCTSPGRERSLRGRIETGSLEVVGLVSELLAIDVCSRYRISTTLFGIAENDMIFLRLIIGFIAGFIAYMVAMVM